MGKYLFFRLVAIIWLESGYCKTAVYLRW